MPLLTEALISELILQVEYLNDPIETIYFGGGTPSLLPLNNLVSILEIIYQNYRVSEKVEVTIECNPEDISPSFLESLKEIGFNRISVGIQSFEDEQLTLLNRNHTAGNAEDVLAMITKSSIANYNLDLIYGIPGLSANKWRGMLQKAVSYEPSHISCYALTIEEQTVLGKWTKQKKFKPLSSDEVAEQFEIMCSTLYHTGYLHYEVSNFALPGFESKHNQSYWSQKHYLGIGPSAHSFNGKSRQNNVANNVAYCKAIAQNEIPSSKEILSLKTKLNEYLLTRLRTSLGINLDYLKNTFDYEFSSIQKEMLKELQKNGQATVNRNTLYLTSKGFLLADKITLELMVETE